MFLTCRHSNCDDAFSSFSQKQSLREFTVVFIDFVVFTIREHTHGDNFYPSQGDFNDKVPRALKWLFSEFEIYAWLL